MVREMGRVESWGFGDGAVLGWQHGRPRARAVWARGDLLVWEVTQGGWYGGYPVIFGPVNTIGVLPALTITIQPVVATLARAAVLWTNDLVLNVVEAEAVKLLKPRARERLMGMLWPVEVGRSGMRSMELVALKGGESDQLKGEVMAQDGLVFLGMEVREAPWLADAQGVVPGPVEEVKQVESPVELGAAGRLSIGYWYSVPPKVWSAMMVVDFTQSPAVVREPVGVPGGLVAVANVGSAGGIVVAFDATTREVRTLVYDGVTCWNYADAVLKGNAGLLAGEAGMVCRVVEEEAASEGKEGSPARLEAYRYGLEQRGFVLGDGWNVEGGIQPSLRVRGGQVFLNAQRDGFWAIRLAGLGSGARLENRRTVMVPAGDYTLNVDAAVVDRLGAGLWVPRGMYGVGYFGAESVVMPTMMVEPAVRVLSAPVLGLPRMEVMGTRTIGPIR